ncbi:undecaprenyl-phosphate glucose phosphotransferase [Allohahella marinimesophila]|uniref:Undecaprenyl-phosphate glucose phosphotransferase n=1 Tax=Allohahella marinimesophila TaxID=1054972 RepID=A0ABP7P951_9GAMM
MELAKQYTGGLIKPYSSGFALLSRSLDSAIIFAAALFSGYLLEGHVSSEFIIVGLIGGLFHQILAEFTDIYRSWRSESLWAEARRILACWTLGFSIIFTAGHMFDETASILTWPSSARWFCLTLFLMLGWRAVVRTGLRQLRTRGFNTRTVAVVGSGSLASQVASNIQSATWFGYRNLGFFDDRADGRTAEDGEWPTNTAFHQHAKDLSGSFEDVVAMAEQRLVDTIFIALPMRAEERIKTLLQRLENSTATVYVVPDLFVFQLLHAKSINLNGIPAVGLIGEPHGGVDGVVKRIEDIVLGSLMLAVAAIPMLLIALLVKLTSRGPVIFKQTRYGLDGELIKVRKFRTMKVCEDGDIVQQASRHDERVTALGRILRRTSLDELPQLFNVLGGSMSIVGPRPHAVAHNESYRALIPRYMLRHKIKPGITGWAQVNGWRGETDTLDKMQKRIEYDLQYLNHWTIWWDVQIILKTLVHGFIAKNAY